MDPRLPRPLSPPTNVVFRYTDNGTFRPTSQIEPRTKSANLSPTNNAQRLFNPTQNNTKLYYSQSSDRYEDRDQGFVRGLSTIWQGDLTVTKRLQKLQKVNHQENPAFLQQQTKLQDQLTKKCQSHFKASVYNEATSHQGQPIYANYQLCKCGCGKRIGDSFPFTTVLEQKCLSLGYTVLLYFQFLYKFAICLFFMTGIYVFYSFVVNIKGSYSLAPLNSDCSFYCKTILMISDYNKDSPLQQTKTQAILGLAAMVFLWIYVNYLFYNQRRQKIELTRQYQSPSDYVIAVDNYPSQEKTQKDLLRILDYHCQLMLNKQGLIIEDYNKNHYKYYDIQSSGEEVHSLQRHDFDLVAIHMVHNMQQYRKRVDSLKTQCITLQKYIQISGQKASFPVDFKQLYIQQKNDILNKYKILHQQREQFLNSQQNRKRLCTQRFFLQYKHSSEGKFAKDMALFQYGSVHYTLVQKFFKKGKFIEVDGHNLQLTRASQPKNIQWQNCQKQLTYRKVIFNYILIILFIIITIIVIQFLSILQAFFDQNKSKTSTIWSFIIGILLQRINSYAWKYFDQRTKDQEMYSHTEYLLSKITKISIFTFLNITLVPLIISYIKNTSYYSTDSINGFIISYHLSWIMTETIGLISPKTLLLRIGMGISRVRKIILNKKYGILNEQIVNSPQFVDKVYSELYSYPDIDIVQSLGTILINVLQAFFFCSLQPILIPLVILQILITYCYSKIKLFRYSKTQNFLDFTLVRYSIAICRMIPISYGIGSIVIQSIQFNHLSNRDNVNNNIFYIISIVFGLIIFINPFQINQKMFDCIFSKFYTQKPTKHCGYTSQMDQNYYKVSTTLGLVGFQEILAGQHPYQGQKDLKRCYQQSLRKDREQLFNEKRSSQYQADRLSTR